MYTNLFFNSEREASFRKFPVRHAYSLRQEVYKKRHCDLRGYIEDRFLVRGVRANRISIAAECTCCSRYPGRSYLFASHHRAKTSGPEERFLAVAALARQPLSLRRLFRRSFFTAQS